MRKRILFLSGTYFPEAPGGSDRIAFDLAREATKTFEVWFLCQDVKRTKKDYENINGINIVRYRIAKAGKYNPLKPRDHLIQVRRSLEKYMPGQINIVHSHTLLPYFEILKSLQHDSTKFIFTIHSPAIRELEISWFGDNALDKLKLFFGLPVIRKIERKCIESSHAITFLSQYTKKLIIDDYGRDIINSSHIIPGWVDESMLQGEKNKDDCRKLLGWERDSYIIFCIRRLEARMGLDALISAISIVRKEYQNIRVYIGGTGSLERSLRRQIDQLRLGNHVKLLGFIREDLLPLMYRASDTTIVPSRSLECFGLTTLESLYCRTPVLVSPVGALPEIMMDIEPRWIMKSCSPEDIAEAIFQIINGEIPSYSMHHYAALQRKYSREESMKKFFELYMI